MILNCNGYDKNDFIIPPQKTKIVVYDVDGKERIMTNKENAKVWIFKKDFKFFLVRRYKYYRKI